MGQRETDEARAPSADGAGSASPAPVEQAAVTDRSAGRARTRKIVLRALLLLVTAVSLYALLPSLLEVFSSWRRLRDLSPFWLVAMGLFEIASFACFWELQRIALRTEKLFAVATSQLAGNAFGRVVPGGMAAAGGLQYGMLQRAGIPSPAIASGITLVSVFSFATVLVLPLASIPAVLGGTPVDRSLLVSALFGLAVFALTFGAGAVLMLSDRVLGFVGRSIQRVHNLVRRGSPVSHLDTKLILERNRLRAALGDQWLPALALSIGRWLFDYLALLAALVAADANPNPSLVILAYVAAQLLGMIPLTPGGLGFVEAGLTGTLVLAGVSAGDAVVATLAYRLVSFWLPIPIGLGAYALFRHRYREAAEPETGS